MNAATGAWSGTTATPRAAPVRAIALPAVFVAVAIGVTLFPPLTYAVLPSGVTATPLGAGTLTTGFGAAAAMSIGVTLFEPVLAT